jgi:NAD(P)-dependent dehydrogenase (short-subunit alcohol dehydrogenase family)
VPELSGGDYGSANGMGKAMALKFAREGCDIAVVDLQLDGANKVVEKIKSGGRKAIAIKPFPKAKI